MNEQYRVTMQYAHHEDSEYDVLEESVTDGLLDIFQSIDWEGEAIKANTIQKVSPTLTFESDNKRLWFSAVYDGSLSFVLDCQFSQVVNSSFGLINRKKLLKLYHDSLPISQVDQAIELFMKNDIDTLKKLYKTY